MKALKDGKTSYVYGFTERIKGKIQQDTESTGNGAEVIQKTQSRALLR